MSTAPVLRAPQHYDIPAPSTFTLPSLDGLHGTWHVTHSTLPLWKDKRNVSITYTALEPPREYQLDDLVTYQTLTSSAIKSVHGIDTPARDTTAGGVYKWRGKGWLAIASSRWEVLGWGQAPGKKEEQWVVTYFAKTLFTPAGVDVYSRRKEGVSEDVLGKIKEALKGVVQGADWEALVSALFEVKRDDGK